MADRSPALAAGGGTCASLEGETVFWIVPYTAGGGYDMLSRMLEPFLEKAIGAQVVIRNFSAAGGLAGARTIRDAAPDGRTIGIVNASGLLVQGLIEGISGYDPVRDFTVLGRVSRPHPSWMTGFASPYHTVEDLFSPDREGPVLAGIVDTGSASFLTVSVGSELLGLDVEYIAGYPGSRETSLALVRGEVDLAGFNFESMRGLIEAGDLRPLLQISDTPTSEHPALRDVPVLAGPEGLAVRRARELGRDPAQALTQADALARLFDVGRLAVAPLGLDPAIARCLRDGLARATSDPDLVATMIRTELTVSHLDAPHVVATIESTADARRALAEQLRTHIEMVQSGR